MSKLKRGERVESDRRARPLDRMAKFDGQRIRSTPFTLIAANLEKTAGLCGSCRAIEFPRTFNRHAP